MKIDTQTIEDFKETLVGIFERSKTDSMGLDTVLYFPAVKWNSEWNNEDE